MKGGKKEFNFSAIWIDRHKMFFNKHFLCYVKENILEMRGRTKKNVRKYITSSFLVLCRWRKFYFEIIILFRVCLNWLSYHSRKGWLLFVKNANTVAFCKINGWFLSAVLFNRNKEQWLKLRIHFQYTNCNNWCCVR